VAGGAFIGAWSLESLGDGRRLFVKTNSAAMLPLLRRKAGGSGPCRWADAELADPGVPLFCGLVGGGALWQSSWLDLRSSGDGNGWTPFGSLPLARFANRACSSLKGPVPFGWEHGQTYIGSGLQDQRLVA